MFYCNIIVTGMLRKEQRKKAQMGKKNLFK